MIDDVVLSVRLAVEPISKVKVTRKELVESAKEAIEEALSNGEDKGFNHSLRDKVSLVVTGVGR